MARTLDYIVKRIIREICVRTNEITDFNVGSGLRSFLDAIGAEIEECDFLRDEAVASLRIQSADGDELDEILNGFRFYRKPAFPSIVKLRFSVNAPAAAAIPIPQGTIASTDPDEIVYQSDATTIEVLEFEVYEEDMAIAVGQTYVDVYAECTRGGALTNAAVGKVNTIVSNLPGVDAVTNPTAAADGADAWTDDEYRKAFYKSLQLMGRCTYQAVLAAVPIIARTIGEKIAFAYLAEGYPEPGFNVLYLATKDGELSTTAQAAAQKYCDRYLRALGTSLTVSAHVKKHLALGCRVRYESGVVNKARVKAALKKRLLNYVRGVNIGGDREGLTAGAGYIYVNRLIKEALDVPGIRDIDFDDVTADVAIAVNEKPWAEEEFDVEEMT